MHNKRQKYYIIIEINQTTVFYKYSRPGIGAPKYKEKILTSLRTEINSNTAIAGDFNIPLVSMNR